MEGVEESVAASTPLGAVIERSGTLNRRISNELIALHFALINEQKRIMLVDVIFFYMNHRVDRCTVQYSIYYKAFLYNREVLWV